MSPAISASGGINPIREVKLAKPCSWTSILKNDAEKYGLVLVYQSGAVEIRSLPDLNVVGESSLVSILRWNSKINMDKTISSPGNPAILKYSALLPRGRSKESPHKFMSFLFTL
ncbi:uncharacterized protein [Nicotiana sylvestris]|uniref:uncharacterized protein n=1 Tax=Nicotiana sylvestris TaxID=4096 RepID=UPI00388C5269